MAALSERQERLAAEYRARWERDEWPAIFEKVIAADILVLTSPIWLGQKTSGQVLDHRQRGRHQAPEPGAPLTEHHGPACISSTFFVTTSIVRPSSALGLNSTTSVPA
jgi:hypothetical protein